MSQGFPVRVVDPSGTTAEFVKSRFWFHLLMVYTKESFPVENKTLIREGLLSIFLI